MDKKPMLATAVETLDQIKFPVLASPKIDGVRATVQGGRLLSRSLKPIPNKNVQAKFAGLPEGLDGELIVGDMFDDPYRRTVSVVMSDDKPADDVNFVLFDKIGEGSYETRFWAYLAPARKGIMRLEQTPIADIPTLEEYESRCLALGAEGVIVRDPRAPYKHGRSSLKEGYLLKVKRFKDAEARIVSCYEEMENCNEAFTNELGRTARSSHKENKVGKGQLGGFHCVGIGDYEGIEFDVSSSSITHEDRKAIWANQAEWVGKLVVYKYFPTGGKDKPRHPIFKGVRDGRDL